MGMLSARRSKSERPIAGRGHQAPPHQLGGMGSAVNSPGGVWGRAPENFEFDAFGDLEIASKHCNVTMKLYERV